MKPFCRKLKRIVRAPQYDNNFINGDMALLQLEKKVSTELCSRTLALEKTSWFDASLGIFKMKFSLVARLSYFFFQVTFSDTIRPACLPDDPTETYGYKVGFEKEHLMNSLLYSFCSQQFIITKKGA